MDLSLEWKVERFRFQEEGGYQLATEMLTPGSRKQMTGRQKSQSITVIFILDNCWPPMQNKKNQHLNKLTMRSPDISGTAPHKVL